MIRPLFQELEYVKSRVRAQRCILLALDFDGTLAPICERPEFARTPVATRSVLNSLATYPGFSVAIISGRSLEDLRARVGLDLIYAGNHGLEISGAGIPFRHPDAVAAKGDIGAACRELARRLEEVHGAVVEDKGLTATVHFRGAPATEVARIHRLTSEALLPFGSLIVLPALRAWEVRPRLDWNKGSAVRAIRKKMSVPDPLTICIGDDETDEDMFDDEDAITIKVGHSQRTTARFSVDGPPDVRIFLQMLHRWVTTDDSATGRGQWRAQLDSLRSALHVVRY
jgi:trehalose 6-phosphate phosphatase